jgi:hypothetical protein
VFVTTDIFDLEAIARKQKIPWREVLIGGVVLHGMNWQGPEAAAQFLWDSARLCGPIEELKYASYSRPGELRMRMISPKSFERITRGELTGPRLADNLLLRGRRAAPGVRGDCIIWGGEASGSRRLKRGPTGPSHAIGEPSHPLRASFMFQANEDHLECAKELFRRSIGLLGAEYGYYFVRDEMCFPDGYPYGIGSSLDFSEAANTDSKDISTWAEFASDELWTRPWPRFRDLYQINLISARHTSTPIEGLGFLHEWIVAKSGRGTLEDIGEGRLIWSLTDAELFNTRPLLARAGILFSCRHRVYRDLVSGAHDPSQVGPG